MSQARVSNPDLLKQTVLAQLEDCFANDSDLILTGGGVGIVRSIMKSVEAREIAERYGCQEKLLRLAAD